ncbi:hypothetical protein BH09PSE5_BH09PSE5_18060 [soil metagenome]
MSESLRYRLGIASRAVAAALGGYVLTSLLTAVLAVALPRLFDTSRAEAVQGATLYSFAAYVVIVICAFSMRRVASVWIAIGGVSALLGALLVAMKGLP